MCCAKCFPMLFGLSGPLRYPGASCLTLPILQMRKVRLYGRAATRCWRQDLKMDLLTLSLLPYHSITTFLQRASA